MTEWRDAVLGDLIDLFDNKRVPLSSRQRAERQGPYPYYGAQGVIDHIDDYIFDGRYILIPEDGENLRSRKLPIAYFAQGRFWVNNHAHIARGKPGVAIDRFVQSALEATDIGPFVTGAAQPKLSQANLRQIGLRVPPLAAQELIASILDSLDDLIENSRRRIELLEDMARAIYREWFVHLRYPGYEDVPLVDSPLGPIPDGWGVSTLGDAGRWLSGGTPKTSVARYWGGPTPWITSGTLTARLLDRSDRTLTPEGVANGTRLVDRDTVVFVVRGMSLVKEFRVGIADVPLAFGQDCKAIVAAEHVEPLYLGFTFFALQDEIQGMVELAGHGTGKLSTDRLKAIPLLVPVRDLQAAFVETVTPMREQMTALRLATDRLVSLRDLLLPKLVSGAIDVSLLDLEPVSRSA
ncbi:MAG: restriction endonuclease subunit S [Actinomycetota bacterium]